MGFEFYEVQNKHRAWKPLLLINAGMKSIAERVKKATTCEHNGGVNSPET
jgi:hypothetical protein